ncbi:MAG: hypothetical protein Q4E16_04170 [Neisseria sp.]|nr:hypothetical protein [Neisseria sp.]
MKKKQTVLGLLTAMTLSLAAMLPQAAVAADWTPVFAYLEKGKKGDDGKMRGNLFSSVFQYKKISKENVVLLLVAIC